MPDWIAQLNVKRFLDEVTDEDVTNGIVRKVAGNILGALNGFIEAGTVDSTELEGIRDTFETLATSVDDATDDNLVVEFDEALNDLYDWGDERRVWIA